MELPLELDGIDLQRANTPIPPGLGFVVPKNPPFEKPSIYVPVVLGLSVAKRVKRKHDKVDARLFEEYSATERDLKDEKKKMHNMEVELEKTKNEYDELVESPSPKKQRNLRTTARSLSKMETELDNNRQRVNKLIENENKDYMNLMHHRKKNQLFNSRLDELKTMAHKKTKTIILPNGEKVSYKALPSEIKYQSRRHIMSGIREGGRNKTRKRARKNKTRRRRAHSKLLN
jgi:hypothetical protein